MYFQFRLRNGGRVHIWIRAPITQVTEGVEPWELCLILRLPLRIEITPF
jgi:hypothetical protein